MAQEVKTNSRKRRPPSYLVDIFQDDSIKPFASDPFSRPDTPTQDADLLSLPTIARLLCKLINSSNKRLQDKAAKKSEEKDNSALLELKEDRLRSYSNHEQRNSFSQQEPSRTKNQEESRSKASTISIELKERERLVPQQSIDQDKQIRDGKQAQDLFADKPTLQQTLTTHKTKLKNTKKSLSKKISKELLLSNKNETFKETQDNEKIFKRAAFHIGIAYNTHFDRIKALNHDFGVKDLDPTCLSKSLRLSKMSQINTKENESEQQNIDKCSINNFMIYQSNLQMADKLRNLDKDNERTASSIGKENLQEIQKKEDQCEQPKMYNE